MADRKRVKSLEEKLEKLSGKVTEKAEEEAEAKVPSEHWRGSQHRVPRHRAATAEWRGEEQEEEGEKGR